jgi:hypothetical protein
LADAVKLLHTSRRIANSSITDALVRLLDASIIEFSALLAPTGMHPE